MRPSILVKGDRVHHKNLPQELGTVENLETPTDIDLPGAEMLIEVKWDRTRYTGWFLEGDLVKAV